MRTGKEINDLYARDVESKTCDNCNHRPGSCMDRDVFSDKNGDCKSWQPIPVATTDTPEPEETTNPIRDLCNELIKAREAIAKRDDLIRRMAFEMRTYPDLGHFAKYSALISEAYAMTNGEA